MKNIHFKLLSIGAMVLFVQIITFAQSINITYPIHGSVIQRNSGNTANISFTGSVGYGYNNSSLYNYTLAIVPLDLF